MDELKLDCGHPGACLADQPGRPGNRYCRWCRDFEELQSALAMTDPYYRPVPHVEKRWPYCMICGREFGQNHADDCTFLRAGIWFLEREKKRRTL